MTAAIEPSAETIERWLNEYAIWVFNTRPACLSSYNREKSRWLNDWVQEKWESYLADKKDFYKTIKETSECPTFDLDTLAWERIKKAASESKWIPEDYYANDWENDVCDFLRNGVSIELLKRVYAKGYNAGHNEGIGCGHPLARRCHHDGTKEAEENEDEIKVILKGG
jgi:hypothetical protein